MIRLTNLADYAVLLMGIIAKDKMRLHTAQSLAQETGLKPPTISKVLGLLSKANLLDSKRGAYGGFSLPKNRKNISVADIVEAIDGPVTLTQCMTENDPDICELSENCITCAHWPAINKAVRNALASVSLSDIAAGKMITTSEET